MERRTEAPEEEAGDVCPLGSGRSRRRVPGFSTRLQSLEGDVGPTVTVRSNLV